MALGTRKCKYCKETIRVEKEKYVSIPSGSNNRYFHPKCYLRYCEESDITPTSKVIDPSNTVRCCYCKKELDKEKDEYVQVSEHRFAHKHCHQKEEEREHTDQELLDMYIKKLFNCSYVSPRIKKQIKQYVEEYDFTYSGILKTLKYFYEIKGNSIENAHGTISIVPYVYKQSFNYFYNIWLAQQHNEVKELQNYTPTQVEVVIQRPVRKTKQKKMFTFLDEEGEVS